MQYLLQLLSSAQTKNSLIFSDLEAALRVIDYVQDDPNLKKMQALQTPYGQALMKLRYFSE